MDDPYDDPLDWQFSMFPPALFMRRRHAALVGERIDYLTLCILGVILRFELPTQALVARVLHMRYWTVRNHVDSSPWVIKHRLDLIRLAVTPEALAMMRRIKHEFEQPSPHATPEQMRYQRDLIRREAMRMPLPEAYRQAACLSAAASSPQAPPAKPPKRRARKRKP